MSEREQWEYRREQTNCNFGGKHISELLEQAGKDGWELCGMGVIDDTCNWFFKRRPDSAGASRGSD